MIRGRTIRPEEVQIIQQLVLENVGTGRSGLARALCERWQWQAANGQIKTRSALAVLTELDRQGLIRLPPPAESNLNPNIRVPKLIKASSTAEQTLDGALNQYRPLRWQLVRTATERREWHDLMARYHYLGAPELVGANLKYLVSSRDGQRLGALGWQSAVHHLGCRDRLIGWNAAQRALWLDHVVNGVRFLVLPWVQVPHLASVILSENICLLYHDWLERYHVPLWLLESFVDRQRFSGASYRAANWQSIGWTRGFAKRQGSFVHHGLLKEVYVYVLEKGMRRLVHADPKSALLTRSYLLAQRLSETNKPLTRRTRMKENQELWKPKLPPELNLNEADLACVGQELNAFTDLFSEAFSRSEQAQLFVQYLQGLLSDTERKNVEAMALKLYGPKLVRNLQRFMTNYLWDDAWMRQRHLELCAESLSDDEGVWSIDASEIGKKGQASVGVAPQYCGSLGKTANCQSGVFICYASPKGFTLLDDQLYLPQCWFEPEWEDRRKACRIPEAVTFKTKPQLAVELLQPLLKAKLFKGRWITCDCSFGNNSEFLEELPPDFYYLAEIACTRKVWMKKASGHEELESGGCTVESLIEVEGLLHWESRKVSEGEKGPIVAAFARTRVYLSEERTAESERWLFLRNDTGGKIKYALSNAPEEIEMKEMVRVSGARWPIERCFQENKSELGLDHYEHRTWTAWHRHMRLVSLAQLFLLRLRIKLKKKLRH